MKCEEMMNLMQQSLDQELTAEEERAMLAHLKQCPGCSDLYVRLKLLNEELAQLPKVKPAYSIVDAILPQLEEMPLWSGDSASGPETSAAAKEQAPVIPLAAARNSRRGLVSWKIFSGVAAAGIVIGLLWSNQDNLRLNNSASESAVMDQNRTGEPQAASAMGKSSGANNKEASPPAEGASHNLAVVPTQTGAAGASSAVPPSATPAAAPETSAEPKDASGRVTMASPTDSSEKLQYGSMLKSVAPEEQGTDIGASPEASEVKQDQAPANPEAADSAPESLPNTAQEEGHLNFTITGKAEKSAAPPEPEQGEGAADARLPDVMSLTGPAIAGTEPQASPDGLYTASVAGGKVTITGKDGAAVFVSSIHLGPEAQVKFGGWTDAHTFTYTVRNVAGTETVYVISAAEGKEWKK